jgi:hypothetical protein
MTECKINQSKLCGETSCTTCFDRSFANTDKASWWSDRNVLNSLQVFKRSGGTFVFNCGLCNHQFEAKPSDLIKSKRCKYCAKTAPLVCGDVKCIPCVNNSLGSINKVIKCWSSRNKVTPFEVSLKTGRSDYWFDCFECDHVFKMRPKCVYEGQWCPYCSHKQLCGHPDCELCFNNSFASHIRSQNWIDTEDPLLVFKCCDTYKYKFKCDNDHIFEVLPNNVTKGTWCPLCYNKTEGILLKFLANKFEDVEHQKFFKWCVSDTTGRIYPFDLYIESKNVIIELDGKQHFEQVRNWKSPEYQRERDIVKMTKALNNNIRVIRILQEDVYNPRNKQWKTVPTFITK